MAKMGRPSLNIDIPKLKAIMRFKPSLKDAAAFFECHPDSIEKFINKKFLCTFSEFREQNMVHSRFSLIRKAMEKALSGDNCMLIFCLKNLCDWKDRNELSGPNNETLMPQIIVTLPDNTAPKD